ncbi:hypothetical protein IEO21_10549 [Rhodonia placenta]|uniref:Uncharacterized protein n=1 Tax=Rhodonia placenta TaxID=104341 RepID=A0A8H7NS88_9APHY|nr:hypothetical protein IEO21_10549 [Postia placenta]
MINCAGITSSRRRREVGASRQHACTVIF